MLLTISKPAWLSQNQEAPLYIVIKHSSKILCGGSFSEQANLTRQPASKRHHARSDFRIYSFKVPFKIHFAHLGLNHISYEGGKQKGSGRLSIATS